MLKHAAMLTALTAILSFTLDSVAADGKPARVTTCDHYSIAKTDTGADIGICAARKAGGKPSMLRSFVIVTLTDPDGKPAKVMIGYR